MANAMMKKLCLFLFSLFLGIKWSRRIVMSLDKTNKVDQILAFHNRILNRAVQLFYRQQEVSSYKREEINSGDELQPIEGHGPVLDGGLDGSIQPTSLQAQGDPSSEIPSSTPPGVPPTEEKVEDLIDSKFLDIEDPQYKGVSFNELIKDKPWRAHIDFMGRDELIGDFKTAEEAARAYNQMAKLYYGKSAELNQV